MLKELTAGELIADRESRVISGSIFRRKMKARSGTSSISYSGISIPEDRDRVFGWFDLPQQVLDDPRIRLWVAWHGQADTRIQYEYKRLTSSDGTIGMFERSCLSILCQPSCALVVDLENAEKLGCLELDEEDPHSAHS